MINKFKLIKIRNDEVLYTDEHEVIQSTNVYDLPSQEAIYNFSAEDQEIINNAAVDDGFYIAISKTGERMLVPYKRQNYIFFFSTLFSVSIMMSVFTSLRYIHIGDIKLYGNFLFFPLAFACTDIINELYGYNRVRTIIYKTVLVFVIMAGLLQITFLLNGTLNNGGSDHAFIDMLYYVPRIIVFFAFSVLCADSLNAYLFHKIKQYLQGRSLWLRSIISTFIAHFFFSPLIVSLEVLSGRLELPLQDLINIVYSGHWMKMLYAICSLPFIYAAVHFVRNKEEVETIKGTPV